MTPSDMIALGALCLSGLALLVSVFISLLGFVFNYYTNNQNIKARRVDIATEKSIEAYQEIAEKATVLRQETIGSISSSGPEEREEIRKLAIKVKEDFFDTINKYRIFLPEDILTDFKNELGWISSFLFIPNKANRHEEDYTGEIRDLAKLETIINRMQKQLGIENKEKSVRK